jgi:hypothetical protein
MLAGPRLRNASARLAVALAEAAHPRSLRAATSRRAQAAGAADWGTGVLYKSGPARPSHSSAAAAGATKTKPVFQAIQNGLDQAHRLPKPI